MPELDLVADNEPPMSAAVDTSPTAMAQRVLDAASSEQTDDRVRPVLDLHSELVSVIDSLAEVSVDEWRESLEQRASALVDRQLSDIGLALEQEKRAAEQVLDDTWVAAVASQLADSHEQARSDSTTVIGEEAQLQAEGALAELRRANESVDRVVAEAHQAVDALIEEAVRDGRIVLESQSPQLNFERRAMPEPSPEPHQLQPEHVPEPADRVPEGFVDAVTQHLDDMVLSTSELALSTSLAPIDLEPAVQRAIQTVREELGERWAPAPEFGSQLHAAVAREVAAGEAQSGWEVIVEQPMKQIADLGELQELTVREWITQHRKDLSHYLEALPKGVLEQQIANMKPDVILRSPDGGSLVWDLTSRQRDEHLAKTMLYAEITAQENQMVRIAETYWRRYK